VNDLMSAFGPKQTCRKTQSMSLLGVKRTSASALQMSAFDPKRTSVYARPPSSLLLRVDTMPCLSRGAGNETARFHHLGGLYSGVAARGLRATAIATNWICSRWICQSIGAPRDRVSTRLERNRLY
jgi:hypothetical protein